MKKILGFLILLIVLVMASGCTQPATTPPATTTVVTEAPTAVPTPVETTIAEPTAVVTAEPTVAITTAATSKTTPVANETTAVVTVAKTTIVTAGMTPSTKITMVHIANGTFSPTPLMVLPGTRITWINDDTTVHSVKAAGAIAGKFNSMDISPKAQWGYDFGDQEGTYEYADGYNPNVTGIIIIKKGESFYGMGTPTTYMTSNATW